MILQDKLGEDADTFYKALISAHEGLTEAQSHTLNARLVLMMANQIGDLGMLIDIFETALQDLPD
ncbi:MAG: DUF2783 domain-containing protein [Sulfitobacter sp.]|uniref:DUF2783 domain-containing protein n=1 Tax=Sulfitobacter sp. TaxID=1903071 RepID=UPI004059526C